MKHSKSAKAELTTALKAGQTSAKTATFNKKPLSKAATGQGGTGQGGQHKVGTAKPCRDPPHHGGQ